MKNTLSIVVASIMLLISVPLSADQYAVTLRDANLVAKPFRDAESIGSITSDTRVLILKRKGGWYQVKNNAQTGWVRLTSLRLKPGKGPENKGKASAPGQQKKAGSLDTLGEALTGGLFTTGSSSNVATTTGIRGLDEEDIGNAEPNEKAPELLAQYAVTPEQAQRFASQANLSKTKLDYLEGDNNTGGSLFDVFSGGGNTEDTEEESP
jgi:hypothetical protein